MALGASRISGSSIGPAVAVAVGALWAFRSAVGFAQPNYVDPVTILDWAAVILFSAGLAALAPGAWLIRELAGRGRVIYLAAALLALGGIVAAVGNFVEDGLGVSAFGDVFAAGVLGTLAGLIGLSVLLIMSRRYLLAALPAATFAGLMLSNEAGGGFLILAAWLVFAVALRRT